MSTNGSQSARDLTLYWNQYSICSLFANYTLSVQNDQSLEREKIRYKIKNVDIYEYDQLEEEYICDVSFTSYTYRGLGLY